MSIKGRDSEPRMQREQSGYVPLRPLAYRIYNLCVALMLLVVFAPLLAGFALVLRVTQGPGVLLRAKRVGQHQQTFDLYRFATVSLEQRAGCVSPRLRPTALGRYLKETGLDTLPQLFNVIKGDMNVFGPRPVRPAIAQIEMARDPNYAMRFTVKPGITGHVQVTMGPGVSQRVRAKLTYRLCRTAVNLPVEIALLCRIALAVLTRTLRMTVKTPTPSGRLYRARRKAQDLHLQLETRSGSYPIYALSQGLLTTPHVVTGGRAQIVIAAGAGVRKAKVTLDRLTHLQGETVFHFTPVNDHAAHLISRYLRGDVILQPARPTWRRPRLSDLQYEIALHEPRQTVPVHVGHR